MGFQEAVKSFYNRYTDFSSRSSRSEYWWVQLFFFILMFVVFLVLGLLGAVTSGADGGLSPLAWGVIVIFGLTHIIPSIALSVRRFHDQDKSGWFYLLSLIPYIGGLIVFVFMLLKGTDGPNRFGEDPLSSMHDTFS